MPKILSSVSLLRSLLFELAFVLFLTGCNTHPAANAGNDAHPNQSADTGQQKITSNPGTLTITPALLKRYQEACRRDTVSNDKKFISDFFDLINKFNGKKPDTTILTVGNIDGDAVQDTIYSRVYYANDTIYVDSKWIKNNRILWRNKYTNPYLELNADLFSDSSRNTWVHFAIGVLYGPPEFIPRNETAADPLVYSQGVEDLDKAGIHTDIEKYKAYLGDFKGQYITCGQPESRERLWIWYKPAQRMITYFQP